MKRFRDIKNYISEISGTSGRACAIVGIAILDRLLTELLRKCFKPQGRSKDPLYTTGFDAKINLAYRLDLLDKENRGMLCKINEIRNIFAHEPNADSFGYIAIRSKMMELKHIGVLEKIIQNANNEFDAYQRDWNNLRSVFDLAIYIQLFYLFLPYKP